MSKQYLDLCKRILSKGVWVDNKRTGKRCKTVINADFVYDCRDHQLHLLTTKQAYWKKAVAEMLGYIKGLSNAADFRALGTDTWDANANAEVWQKSPYCLGKDDMGKVYGVQGRSWLHRDINGERTECDQLRKVYENLKKGIDDRGEIITYWNVGDLESGCLRPCMYSHTFSILDGVLYLTSYQRSDDIPLGHGFNQIQVSWFLLVMAQITGLKPGIAYHKIVNAHIYEDQIKYLQYQLERSPFPLPTLIINPRIKTLEDLENSTIKDYAIRGYEHHPGIHFPFSV
jgi:thymidylate synthase